MPLKVGTVGVWVLACLTKWGFILEQKIDRALTWWRVGETEGAS